LPPLAQNGQLPLHHAAAKQAGPEVVAALLHVYPDAASTADTMAYCEDFSIGKLPLHHAVANQAGPEVVEALLQACRDAASRVDEVRCGADVLCYPVVQRCVCVHVCDPYHLADLCNIVHMRTDID